MLLLFAFYCDGIVVWGGRGEVCVDGVGGRSGGLHSVSKSLLFLGIAKKRVRNMQQTQQPSNSYRTFMHAMAAAGDVLCHFLCCFTPAHGQLLQLTGTCLIGKRESRGGSTGELLQVLRLTSAVHMCTHI